MKVPLLIYGLFSALCTASSLSKNSIYDISPLFRSPQTLRHLEYNNSDGRANDIDLSQYSIQFQKCQTTKQYSRYNNDNSILSTKRLVIFRLCPTASSSCDSKYGEYLIDMDSYLQSTVPYMEATQEQYCETCNACIESDDDTCNSVDTNKCYTTCQNIANMANNGYVDAIQYIQCGKVYENGNTGVVYYAGAMCSSSTKIKIGLFQDEACSIPSKIDNIDRYIKNENGYNVKLSYHLLKRTFTSDDMYLASCAQDDGEVSEMCTNLYQEAGKCEARHGFLGMSTSYRADYSSQSSNEEEVCDFISNIKSGHYDESGEIVLTGISTYKAAMSSLSDGQVFALAFFVVGTVGMVLYVVYLRQQIAKNQKELF